MDAVIDQNARLEAREATVALARSARGQPLDRSSWLVGTQVIFRENIPPRADDSGLVFAHAVSRGGYAFLCHSQPNTKGPLRIAFLSFQNNPFWFPVRDGAEAVAKYLKDRNVQVDYTVLGDNLTAEAVVSGMETAIAKKYNGIVVVPIFDGTARIIDEAVDAGIPVLTLSLKATHSPSGYSLWGRMRKPLDNKSESLLPRRPDAKGR